MDPQDFAKLAGINNSPKANVEALPDMARQIAMLAGVVPARGQSALASDTLVADSGLDPSLLGPVAEPDESFLTTMSRAAGMNGAMLEEGMTLPLDAIPPPVFAPPPGIPMAEDVIPASRPSPEVATMVVRTEVPAWAWELRDAVENLLEKTIEPKDALKAMKDALEASKATPRNAPETVVETVTESEEERQWKSYINRMLED